jgi:HicB-like protein involved in pilus formation
MAANAEPLEEREPSHSGRLLLRMPKALHAELAARSDAEGVSLNQFIVAALSRAAAGEGTEAAGHAGPRPLSPTLRIALIANAVVVAVAAATAIALIVIAWR